MSQKLAIFTHKIRNTHGRMCVCVYIYIYMATFCVDTHIVNGKLSVI